MNFDHTFFDGFPRRKLSEYRDDITRGDFDRTAFKEFLKKFINKSLGGNFGYDDCDNIVDELLGISHATHEELEENPDAISYQPTPARLIIEMVERIKIDENIIFYDLGSGIGRVPMLVNIITGAKTRGVELEPTYAKLAKDRIQELGLKDVSVIGQDARVLDYDDGDVFFFFDPFRGQTLNEVVEKLHQVSLQKSISICSVGTCTNIFGIQEWLRRINYDTNSRWGLVIFESTTPNDLKS